MHIWPVGTGRRTGLPATGLADATARGSVDVVRRDSMLTTALRDPRMTYLSDIGQKSE
jgi:hypothetical protein